MPSLPPEADEAHPGSLASSEVHERAMRLLRAAMTVAAEISLDLEVTWGQARELFASTLFERAERRYGTAPRIAAALDTSLRTVKQYRHRRREDESMPSVATFNMRRRVLQLLERRPRTLPEIEEALPVGSDVNYARSAVQSLIEDGLAVRDPENSLISSPVHAFVPWYLRADPETNKALENACEAFARLLGTHLTAKGDQATYPAQVNTLTHVVSREDVAAYQRELKQVLAEFEARWNDRVSSTGAGAPTEARLGAVVAGGEIGWPPAPSSRGESGPLPVARDDDLNAD